MAAPVPQAWRRGAGTGRALVHCGRRDLAAALGASHRGLHLDGVPACAGERPPGAFDATALDVVPQDWLAALPGEVLAAAPRRPGRGPRPRPACSPQADLVSSEVAGGAVQVFTDFRAGPDGFTRFLLVQEAGGPILAGRIMQQLFEIETYRLLALLAFPVANASAVEIAQMEAEARRRRPTR